MCINFVFVSKVSLDSSASNQSFESFFPSVYTKKCFSLLKPYRVYVQKEHKNSICKRI